MSQHATEVAEGRRFEFGENWGRFVKRIDASRIADAEQALCQSLGVSDLSGMSFLDIGSGSGLSSLVARRMGARVHSFDYDLKSVATTCAVREKFCPDDPEWTVEEGSALDAEYLRSLGKFDLVYSWGVLHHTGQMWKALENATIPVAEHGQLLIAIYNHQNRLSALNTLLKRTYVAAPRLGKWLILGAFMAWRMTTRGVFDLVRARNPFHRYTMGKKQRGMSFWYDVVDWVGGYPFETARPDEIFHFFRARGFELEAMSTLGGLGYNEFVFRKRASTKLGTTEVAPESDSTAPPLAA